MKEIIKIYSILIGIYLITALLGFVVMGDITDKYRWDLLFMFWGGCLYQYLINNND